MFNRPKLLVLTLKTGGGHVSLAEALRDQFEHNYDINIVDPYPDFFHTYYRLFSLHSPWLLTSGYRLTKTSAMSLHLHQILTPLAAKQLNRELDRFQPDVIITTHPFLSYEVKRVLDKISSDAPLVLLFAESRLHPNWLSERNAAATFATTRESYQQALNSHFNPDRLHLVGWPLRRQFYRNYESTRAELFTKFNFDPSRFTVYLQGGIDGAAKIERTVENVLATDHNLQVLFAAGTNQTLLKRFTGVKNLYAFPYTSEIVSTPLKK